MNVFHGCSVRVPKSAESKEGPGVVYRDRLVGFHFAERRNS